MIDITKYTLGSPDTDGDMRLETSVCITNTSDETIRQIRYSTAVIGYDGGPDVFNPSNVEDVVLDPSETTNLAPNTWVKSHVTAGNRNDVKMIVAARLMKRDIINLGEIKTPAPGKSISKVVTTNSDVIEPEVLINVRVSERDEDGEHYAEIKILLKNAGDKFIEQARFQAQLFDEEGVQIEDAFSDDNIPASTYGMIETSFWGMKKSRLRNTTIKIGLQVFSDVLSCSTEKFSTPEDN